MANPWLRSEPNGWINHVSIALNEDIGSGDITTATFPVGLSINWYVEAQGSGIVSGLGIVEFLLSEGDNDCTICLNDGDAVSSGIKVAYGRLDAKRALSHERTALNYLMLLSGVASYTHQYVQAIRGTNAQIVDTRKTIPGMRSLQKYAVRCGGGKNHRMGLYDAVMIKDNHIRAHGSIKAAVDAARLCISHLYKVEVECDTVSQVKDAISAGADVVLLDNMEVDAMRAVVDQYKSQAIFEASGGVNLDSVRAIAETGVDVISVGSVTHSAPALHFHMELS